MGSILGYVTFFSNINSKLNRLLLDSWWFDPGLSPGRIHTAIWQVDSTDSMWFIWSPGEIQVDYACQFGCAPSQKKKQLDSRWTLENHLDTGRVHLKYVGQGKVLDISCQFFLENT